MGPLELFAILVLAGAIIVLLYYYIQEIKGSGGTGFEGVKSSISDKGSRVWEGISEQYQSFGGERMVGVSEKVSEMGEKLKGKVKEVPIGTDVLSRQIDEFLNEQSEQLIKDWELATKSDISGLEKKFSKVSRDVGELESRFNEFRGFTNKRIKHIEERLGNLEDKEEK
ncbi:MAG: hypothetical protein PQ964_02070 [Methanobacteriaceae archaeon]|jgi:hypothetical protein